ncbi:MAG: ScyD/ScyE family protein, partial [Actinoplanes sp.]
MRFTCVLKVLTAVGTSGLIVLAGTPANAGHAKPAVRTITTKMSGPFGLDVVSSRTALVAEGDSGEVTAVDLRNGRQRRLISGLTAPSGVAAMHGKLYVLLGGPGEGAPARTKYPPASVLVARPNGSGVRVLANLMTYELKHNPDRQPQFDESGKPYDALSNPFSMTATKWGLLVADGGANDVLKVNPRTGKVSTFFVPPNPRTKQCLAAGGQANLGVKGCDSVPTGVAVRGNHVYVSTLGAEK